jgi:hypothetical protein
MVRGQLFRGIQQVRGGGKESMTVVNIIEIHYISVYIHIYIHTYIHIYVYIYGVYTYIYVYIYGGVFENSTMKPPKTLKWGGEGKWLRKTKFHQNILYEYCEYHNEIPLKYFVIIKYA